MINSIINGHLWWFICDVTKVFKIQIYLRISCVIFHWYCQSSLKESSSLSWWQTCGANSDFWKGRNSIIGKNLPLWHHTLSEYWGQSHAENSWGGLRLGGESRMSIMREVSYSKHKNKSCVPAFTTLLSGCKTCTTSSPSINHFVPLAFLSILM